jgi:hypothetical protein
LRTSGWGGGAGAAATGGGGATGLSVVTVVIVGACVTVGTWMLISGGGNEGRGRCRHLGRGRRGLVGRRLLHLLDDLGLQRSLDHLDHLAREAGDEGIADGEMEQPHHDDAGRMLAEAAL